MYNLKKNGKIMLHPQITKATSQINVKKSKTTDRAVEAKGEASKPHNSHSISLEPTHKITHLQKQECSQHNLMLSELNKFLHSFVESIFSENCYKTR